MIQDFFSRISMSWITCRQMW